MRDVPPDRCRVVATVGRTYVIDLPADNIPSLLLTWERKVGCDPPLDVLRGTPRGVDAVGLAVLEYAKKNDGLFIALAVLWTAAHSPTSQGWEALEGLGGSIVQTRPLPDGRGWVIEVCRPRQPPCQS